MWTLRIATFVTTVAAIAAWIGQAYIIERYVGLPLSSFAVFLIAHPFSKLGMMLLSLMGMMLAVASLIGLFFIRSTNDARKLTPFEMAISISALAAIGLSALLAAYVEMSIGMAIKEIGPVRFEIIAPQKVEQLFALSLALWPAAFAFAAMLAGRIMRGRKSPVAA